MSTLEKLPPDVEATYTRIIDGILASADLTTISAKAIRRGLQTEVDHDISHQKKQITELIMQRFDNFNPQPEPEEAVEVKVESQKAAASNGTYTSTVKKETNGTGSSKKRASPFPSDDEQQDSEHSSAARSPPPKKKHKKSQSVELSDAALAARLQAEENGRMARATRGGNSAKRKTAMKKKDGKEARKKKKKSKARVGSGDDSEAESGGEKKEIKRTGGFHKPMALSEPLTALLGETQLSRPQTVKRIWEYIKAHDLQDPSDKRQILCDHALRIVFKTDKVHMFTMNKILNQNLYKIDDMGAIVE